MWCQILRSQGAAPGTISHKAPLSATSCSHLNFASLPAINDKNDDYKITSANTNSKNKTPNHDDK